MDEKVRAAGDPSRAITGYNHVHVGMMREGGAPGMEDGDDADAGAQVIGVGGYRGSDLVQWRRTD